MKNFISVSEETAKEIARQFFGFDAPCVQTEVNCKKAWWDFDVGNIKLVVRNFFNVKRDKYPLGEIYLCDTILTPNEPSYDPCGTIALIDGKISIASNSHRYLGAGYLLAHKIDAWRIKNNQLTGKDKKYLANIVVDFKKEVEEE